MGGAGGGPGAGDAQARAAGGARGDGGQVGGGERVRQLRGGGLRVRPHRPLQHAVGRAPRDLLGAGAGGARVGGAGGGGGRAGRDARERRLRRRRQGAAREKIRTREAIALSCLK